MVPQKEKNEEDEDGNRNPAHQRQGQVKESSSPFRTIVDKDASGNDMLIATIIATVTFAAAFQVPGGYESDGSHKGLPFSRNTVQFTSFMISDSLAFAFACSSILAHFTAYFYSGEAFTKYKNTLPRFGQAFSFFSTLAMVCAFLSAPNVVSGNSTGPRVATYLGIFSFLGGFYFVSATICGIMTLTCFQ